MLQTLIARPGLLRSACDGAERIQPGCTSSTPGAKLAASTRGLANSDRIQEGQLCSCRQRRHRSYFAKRYTNFELFHATDTVYRHDDRCLYRLWPQRLYKYGINFSHWSNLLLRGVQASFSITIGAGGQSISPEITFRARVPSDAPAFATLRNLYCKVSDGESLVPCLEPTLQQLAGLFRRGEASVTDVNERGQTLLHVRI